MMSERLKSFVERAEQLPQDAQDRLVSEIEDLLDEAQCHALLADPRSGPVLDELIAEAKRSLVGARNARLPRSGLSRE